MSRSIYVIAPKGRGGVKIGIAKSLRRRLGELQVGSSARLFIAFAGECDCDPSALENAAHRRLERFRLAGEWFNITIPEAIQIVEGIAAEMGVGLRPQAAPRSRVPIDERIIRVGERIKKEQAGLRGSQLSAILPTSRRSEVAQATMSDKGLVPVPTESTLPPSVAKAVRDFIAGSYAQTTIAAYASDWKNFTSWCDAHQKCALPAEPLTVAAYLAHLAKDCNRKFSTVQRRCAAIVHAHKAVGLANPAANPGVVATLRGIARERGTAPSKKAALTADLLAKTVRKIPTTDGLAGLRDRALLLIGFAAALRRSELVALDVADVARHPKGALITVRRSKTDQLGRGMTKAIPHGKKLHAIEALDAYLVEARIVDGAIFRPVRGNKVLPRRLNGREVARIVQRRCGAIGLDAKAFGGHSLRSGFITSADDAGASLKAIADHAGHAKIETTAGYVQSEHFRNHPGGKFL